MMGLMSGQVSTVDIANVGTSTEVVLAGPYRNTAAAEDVRPNGGVIETRRLLACRDLRG
jgi:hypothetical protein